MADNAFTVDPQALTTLARKLVIISAKLDEARLTTAGVDASQFGSNELSEATGDFVQHWKFLTDRLKIALGDTADILSQASLQYLAVEDAQNAAQGIGADF